MLAACLPQEQQSLARRPQVRLAAPMVGLGQCRPAQPRSVSALCQTRMSLAAAMRMTTNQAA